MIHNRSSEGPSLYEDILRYITIMGDYIATMVLILYALDIEYH